jgi:hypothetical protein
VYEALSKRGWQIEKDRALEDDEFCPTGPADPDVVDAWRARLGFMMPRFVERFGAVAKGFDSAFMHCLISEEHRSRSWVCFTRPSTTAGAGASWSAI